MLQANDAKITLVGQQPGRSPLEFPLHHLQFTDLSSEHPARFTASLTNAVSKGEIEVSGVFGPWNVETPRATFLQAEYGLEYADLATINGLQGILSSVGSFSGPLDYLSIKGTTDTPNFTRRSVGNPIALHTDFVAAVDGTNGNTYLQRVVAHFLHSTLVATGEVVDLDREPPVDLEASSESARVEDLIRLAVKTAEPILTGLTRLKAKIHIAEEDADLDERLGGPRSSGSTTGNSPTPRFRKKSIPSAAKARGSPRTMRSPMSVLSSPERCIFRSEGRHPFLGSPLPRARHHRGRRARFSWQLVSRRQTLANRKGREEPLDSKGMGKVLPGVRELRDQDKDWWIE